ncbi:unnamed protein product, partial [Prorocentrum cordatum]
VWHIAYQAECRCRLELLERLHMQVRDDYEEAKQRGKDHPCDPDRPWNLVRKMAADDAAFWRYEFEDPALLVLAKTGELVHHVQNGKFAANRSGVRLCQAFQTGQCGQTRRNKMCPWGTGGVRQCEHCWGTGHGSAGANACPGCVIPSGALSTAPAAVDNSGHASLRSQEARALAAPAPLDPSAGGGRQKIPIHVVLAEPETRWGLLGIAVHLRKVGAQTAVYDTDGGEASELLAQNVWRELDAGIGALEPRGCALAPPPAILDGCRDGGPAFRGEAPPDIYGFRRLSPEVAERVRGETALPGRPSSVLELPEWQAIVDSPGVVASPRVWGAVGADAARPVEIAHLCADLAGAAAGPAAAHPPLAGRLLQAAARNRLAAPEAEAALVRSGRSCNKLARPAAGEVDGVDLSDAQVSFALPLRQREPGARAALLAQEAELDAHRPAFAALLGASSWSPAWTEARSSDCRADMLGAWAARAGDPGSGVAEWFIAGASAGIVKSPPEDGVSPLASDNAPPCPIGNLVFDAVGDSSDGEFARLGEGAVEEIKSYAAYASRGWLASAATLEGCREKLGGAPALSKSLLLAKVKEGGAKRRLVINLKASSVIASTARTRRAPLPGIMGAVQDALEVLCRREGDSQFGVEWLVVDFDDAFWNVPL